MVALFDEYKNTAIDTTDIMDEEEENILYYETMLISRDRFRVKNVRRYATLDEAIKGHNEIVEVIKTYKPATKTNAQIGMRFEDFEEID